MAGAPWIIATDLEGCLIPEIWINLAERTGIQELNLTTRDIPDYDELMGKRLGILDDKGVTMKDLEEVISGMDPLPGAREYLDWIRDRVQLIILSDTFYEFARPLMIKLGLPTLFCHTLEIDDKQRIVNYKLRTKDGKRGAVRGFQENGFRVISIGDSYNDTTMLGQADHGILFRAPENVIQEFPQYPVFTEYADLRGKLEELMAD